MSVDIDLQILITRSAIAMLKDIHHLKSRVSFPHVSRTGLSEAQVFELLTGLDPLLPYRIKNWTTTTTAQEDGGWNWTFLMDYAPGTAAEQRARLAAVKRSVSFLAPQLFQEQMPDYIKVYRACAFLAGSITYEYRAESHPFLQNAYGALIEGACGCQGYAQAMKLLLDAAGIPCMVISGPVLKEGRSYARDRFDYDRRTKSTRHFWNLVGLETTEGILYFHVDACWDEEDGVPGLHYFLKDDRFMENSRKWEHACYPDCPALPGDDVEELIRAAL